MSLVRSPNLLVDGAKIKERREELGLTQAHVAARIGVDRAAISQWESGKTQPSAGNFKALCAVLKCGSKDLLVVSDDQAA